MVSIIILIETIIFVAYILIPLPGRWLEKCVVVV